MGCFNRNTSQWKDISSKFKSPIVVDTLITKWQKASKSERIPELFEIESFLKQQNNYKKGKALELKKSIENNISALGLNSKSQIKNILKFWNIDSSVVDSPFSINANKLYKLYPNIDSKIKDMSNNTHVFDIIEHMQKMFPDLSIEVASEEKAQEDYRRRQRAIDKGFVEDQLLPEFKDIKSYYVGNTVMLIEGRIDSETAAEEVLHPLINTIYNNNKGLFTGLLSEAKKNFKQLNLDVNNSYTDQRGFTQQDRDLELVTKAVSKTFNKEFDQQVTSSWRDKIKQLLKYFTDVIKNLSNFISGKKLQVSPEILNSKTNLTDLAKLLNTRDLEFRLNTEDLNKGTKLQFSLTNKREKHIKKILSQSTSEIQKDLIKKLSYVSRVSEKESDTEFSATGHLNKISTPLVIQDKKTKKYVNLDNLKDKVQSVDGLIKKNTNYQTTISSQEEFKNVLEAKVLGLPVEEVEGIENIGKEQAVKMYKQLDRALQEYLDTDIALVPNVIIADASTDNGTIADTANILAINKHGHIQVINVEFLDWTKDIDKATIEVLPDNILYDVLPLNSEGTKKISVSMINSVRVNTTRRMLENMGFDSMTNSSIIYVDNNNNIKKFDYSPMDNVFLVDKISQQKINQEMADELYEKRNGPALDEELNKPQTDEKTEQTLNTPSYAALVKQIKDYKTIILSKKELLLRITPNIESNEFVNETINEIDRTITIINVALEEGTADLAFEEIMESSIENVDKMIKYINTPSNLKDAGYITRILNYEKMGETYRGLAELKSKDTAGKEEIALTTKQYQLKDKLQSKLNTLVGINKKNRDDDNYLVKTAVQNYIKDLIVNTSIQGDKFTEEDLDNLMTMGKEIGAIEYGTGTAATSEDPIFALMDKIYKIQHQKSLDRMYKRSEPIRRILTKLERLSPRGVINWESISQMDEEGNYTGRTVQKIGYNEYWKLKEELYQAMYDGGVKQDYIVKEKLSKEEIEYNKKVRAAREKFGEFMKAEEVITDDNLQRTLVDGNRHKYSEEFKSARKKHTVFVASGKYGYWKKREGVSDKEYQSYRNKWFFEREIDIAELDPVTNEFTGYVTTISKEIVKPVVDGKFTKEIKEETRDGKVQTDPKWREIMKPDLTDELAVTMKEYFIIHNKTYGDMLDKLPQDVRDRMYGRSPTIATNITRDIVKEGSWLTRMWAKWKKAPGDWWHTTGSTKKQLFDENGDPVDTVPIYYVGNVRTDKALKDLNEKKKEVTKLWRTIGADGKRAISDKKYDEIMYSLNKEERNLRAQPTREELSMNHGANLLKFIGMAENYETMSEIKDTLESMMRVMKGRKYSEDYTPTNVENTAFAALQFKYKSLKGDASGVAADDSYMYARAKKWMKMVYYDNDRENKGIMDKVTSNLIWLSSMTYVGWNPFGNLNNYAMGQIANAIEAAGGSYFDRMAYVRATKLFNLALPQMMKKLGDKSTWAEFTGGRGKFSNYIPSTKYEALADEAYRMMDKKADIREQNTGRETDKGRFMQMLDWGFLIQDGVEYNVQTKVGMAVLLSKRMQKRDAQGNVLGEKSLYDVYQYNNKTGELTMEEGYDWYMDDKGGHRKVTKDKDDRVARKWSDEIRYEIRNYIREVNITMHGNYAHVDRMVIQSHWLGQLAAQFHKWAAPLWKQRFRKEYYDENLGWMEGRYRTFWSFLTYLYKTKADAQKDARTPGFFSDSTKGEKRRRNMLRNIADLTIFTGHILTYQLLKSLWDDDEDQSDSAIRIENALLYQLRRSKYELQFFYPVVGWHEMGKMIESPIASTRTLGELGEALTQTGLWLFVGLPKHQFIEDYNIYEDKYFYYQKGFKRGQSKLKKNWMDIIPLLYALNRWIAYDDERDFFIQ